ncbi:hypothetical protein EBU71_07330 [bacterium]|nr:hypothetical protein [Candidatus Elulimicrobium humile]
MKNLKLELFNFVRGLDLEQEEISTIVNSHMNMLGRISEKQAIHSLNEKLKIHTYDRQVRKLLESLNTDLENFNILYELKHLYNVLSSKNQGELYRQPINVLLETINLESDQDRMGKIVNELAIYDWVPEIKLFVHNLTKSPEQRSNLLSGGSSESIYTVVEQVEKTLLENWVKNEEDLRILRNIETGLKYADIQDDKINFRISENLVVGISVTNEGLLYINGDKMNKETTLETLFQSPIIPIVNKNFYPILLETQRNLDKFVELDVVKRVSNLINPYLECYVFNYKSGNYVYRCDQRYGNSFYKYDTALELVNEIKNELNSDLTYFFENKLDKEIIKNRKLEDKEREITLKLEDVNINLEKIKNSLRISGESQILLEAKKNLTKRKEYLEEELMAVKEVKSSSKYHFN